MLIQQDRNISQKIQASFFSLFMVISFSIAPINGDQITKETKWHNFCLI
jgi:hypothetical protein